MADKREQCEKCTMNCPPNIIQAKINKGRIPFDKCMDFTPIQTNAMRIRSMTDEELAEKLIHKQDGKWICSDMETFSTKAVAIVHELHWLKSEAE